MSSLSSEVKVANLALTSLGADRILSLTEDSENARKVNAVFDLIRDEVLRAHPWNFAISRRSFNLLAAAPEYGFSNAFQIQGDVLRILETESDYTKYVVEGDQVLTDDTEFNCKCIVRVTDTTKWTTDFVTAFAARLAAELAYPIADSRTLAEQMYVVYKEKIAMAKSTDGQEGQNYTELSADEWLDARYNGGASIPRAELP